MKLDRKPITDKEMRLTHYLSRKRRVRNDIVIAGALDLLDALDKKTPIIIGILAVLLVAPIWKLESGVVGTLHIFWWFCLVSITVAATILIGCGSMISCQPMINSDDDLKKAILRSTSARLICYSLGQWMTFVVGGTEVSVLLVEITSAVV